MEIRTAPPFIKAKLLDLSMLAENFAAAASERESLIARRKVEIEDVYLSRNRREISQEEAVERFDKLNAEIDKLKADAQSQRLAADAALDVARSCERFVEAVPPGVVLAEAEAPAAPTGGLMKALDEVRADIAAVETEMAATPRSLPTREEAQAAAARYVAERAEKPRVPGIRRDGKLEVDFGHSGVAGAVGTPYDMFGVLCWLFPAILSKELAKLVAVDDGTLTDAQREAKLLTLADRLLGLERLEEAIVSACLQRGQQVARRRRADPVAVLGCEPQAAKPATAARQAVAA